MVYVSDAVTVVVLMTTWAEAVVVTQIADTVVVDVNVVPEMVI